MLQAKTDSQKKHIQALIQDLRYIMINESGLHIDDFITFDLMEIIVDYLRTADKKDELFETCWLAYRRKGSKKKAKEYWCKLNDKEKESVLPHIKAYVSSRELSYQKDFERYLRDKIFTTIVFNKNNIVYDPTRGEETKYIPETSPLLMWNDYYKCYMYLGYWDGDISDGYTNDDRPNGASITLNNGRGTFIWDSESKKWVKNSI